MNNFIFTGRYFDENGDTFVEDTILDDGSEELDPTPEPVLCGFVETYLFNKSEVENLDYKSTDDFDFDDVQDDDLEYATNNFIERNISLFDYLDEDLADFNMLNFTTTNTEHQSKKRKHEYCLSRC